ncbi:hypothetical protein FISHEDRAFT_59500 [Fistulina hepatica ATCC 64428]|uniref:Uncharacterized protein n=1 Tax=Fistulina hepatica ATCC 64428 TaxID=1128425 RepID=A0A0D7A9F3_9AGAR|nr:hypothetical protein FISHEDRAFT_59500 [Fistulina hepatica ATCC 64428]
MAFMSNTRVSQTKHKLASILLLLLLVPNTNALTFGNNNNGNWWNAGRIVGIAIVIAGVLLILLTCMFRRRRLARQSPGGPTKFGGLWPAGGRAQAFPQQPPYPPNQYPTNQPYVGGYGQNGYSPAYGRPEYPPGPPPYTSAGNEESTYAPPPGPPPAAHTATNCCDSVNRQGFPYCSISLYNELISTMTIYLLPHLIIMIFRSNIHVSPMKHTLASFLSLLLLVPNTNASLNNGNGWWNTNCIVSHYLLLASMRRCGLGMRAHTTLPSIRLFTLDKTHYHTKHTGFLWIIYLSILPPLIHSDTLLCSKRMPCTHDLRRRRRLLARQSPGGPTKFGGLWRTGGRPQAFPQESAYPPNQYSTNQPYVGGYTAQNGYNPVYDRPEYPPGPPPYTRSTPTSEMTVPMLTDHAQTPSDAGNELTMYAPPPGPPPAAHNDQQAGGFDTHMSGQTGQ